MNKATLRKQYGLIRKSISDRQEKDNAIFENLQPIVMGHQAVFTYVSMGSEVDTHKFIQTYADKVYIPYTVRGPIDSGDLPLMNGHMMKCRKYLGGSLNADKLGNIAVECYGEEGEPTLTIVPMLAFDRACYRLGYGGGYYDRFLSSAFTVKVGLAYDEQYTEENFAEIFDIPLDMIITPTRIFRRGK